MDVKDLAVNVAKSALDSVEQNKNIGEIAEHAAQTAVDAITSDKTQRSVLKIILGFLFGLFRKK